MKISVIIPIYNAEMFLRQCIDSVISQENTDIEIILVDDGSTDSSVAICDEAERKYNSVVVIHKKNGGVSSARNMGIRRATGEYIFFVDSDDEMAPEAVKKIYSYYFGSLNGRFPDLIFGNVLYKKNNLVRGGLKLEHYTSGKKSVVDFCEDIAKDREQLPWRPYEAVVKRSFILENDLFYDESITSGEDCLFFFSALKLQASYAVLPVNYVIYREDTVGSIVKTVSYKNVVSQLTVFKRASSESEEILFSAILTTYFANRFVGIVLQIPEVKDKSDRERLFQFVRSNLKTIRSASQTGKFAIAKFIWKTFGFRYGTSILGFARRIQGRG